MWRTLELPSSTTIDWNILREEKVFLYRRIADQQRAVLAVGVKAWVKAPLFDGSGNADDWYFAALTYEWMQPGGASTVPNAEADASVWFVPQWVVEWKGDEVSLHTNGEHDPITAAQAERLLGTMPPCLRASALMWQVRTNRTSYLQKVGVLLDHIQRGDIYEINYCTERRALDPSFDPFCSFHRLLSASQAPFAGFYRNGDRFALCASPERFLAIEGRSIKGQPMKGTRKRSSDPQEDERLAIELAADPKERSENIMALDVMRNDLSRVAASRSVRVVDLCKVVNHAHVHQMISTVKAELSDEHTPLDALLAAFPMASMTGAPKLRAMQLIEHAEDGPRGLFSGTLGFFAPDGTGDFNVVIRTAMFDASTGELAIRTGSAITALCEPEREWEECELKAHSVIEAMRNVE